MIFGEKLEKQYINVAENINIAVCIKGAGPPLLLLHGYPQTGYMWHKIAPRLAKDFTVIVADLRGYGDSDKPASSDDHVSNQIQTGFSNGTIPGRIVPHQHQHHHH